MDLFQLETFLAVAAERSFSRAALRLHRTQPAISQTVRKLEDAVGERLLDRSGREAVLTDAGKTLAGYAERLLNLRGEARQALRELRTGQLGKLAIAANEYSALHLVRVLGAYRERHPGIALSVGRLPASRIPAAVLNHEWELGLVTYRPLEAGLRCYRIYGDRLALVVAPGHRLAGRRRRAAGVGIGELGGETFVAHNTPSPLRQEVIAAFRHAATPLRMDIEMPTLEAVRRSVAAGAGIALLPRLAVEAELERGELVEVRLRDLHIEHHLRIVHRRSSPLSHAAQALLALLAERAKGTGPEALAEE